MRSGDSTPMELIIHRVMDMATAMDTMKNRRPCDPDPIGRESGPWLRVPKQTGAKGITSYLCNALILSALLRGKQLQLWDSNVHNKETRNVRFLQVPRKYHK